MAKTARGGMKAPKGLMTVMNFTRRYGPGRTKTYGLMKDGTLKVRKFGKINLIEEESAEDWAAALPKRPVTVAASCRAGALPPKAA